MLETMRKAFKFDVAKFSSSGREDVDVRMLGKGRPFLFELVNSRKVNLTSTELDTIQCDINLLTKDIFVRDLQLVTKDSIKALKDGEDAKRKTYTALCVISKEAATETVVDKLIKLEEMGEVKLSQRTPIRVLHRRLCTQAGTYVKEFVHGDFGRTTPSLCSIIECDVDIIALDVEAIDLDWPPSLDPISTSGLENGQKNPRLLN